MKVTLLLGSGNQVPQCHLVSAGPSVLRSKGDVRSCHAPARCQQRMSTEDEPKGSAAACRFKNHLRAAESNAVEHLAPRVRE